jgi:hypothetical protein
LDENSRPVYHRMHEKFLLARFEYSEDSSAGDKSWSFFGILQEDCNCIKGVLSSVSEAGKFIAVPNYNSAGDKSVCFRIKFGPTRT